MAMFRVSMRFLAVAALLGCLVALLTIVKSPREFACAMVDSGISRTAMGLTVLAPVDDDAPGMPTENLEYQGEFGFELTTMLPYAYYLHRVGRLNSTASCGAMSALYYFSPHHENRACQRSYGHSKVLTAKHGFPLWWGDWPEDAWVHWQAPPFRAHFQAMALPDDWPRSLSWKSLSAKPLVVIANKYTIEWDHDPVNFISLDALDKLLTLLTPHFVVVYNRPLLQRGAGADDQKALPFEDHDLVRGWQHPDNSSKATLPIVLQDLSTPDGDMNLQQLLVYSRSTRFISVQGGVMVLPSYFGGIHVIVHREGREHGSNAYETAFPRLGGAFYQIVRRDDELITRVEQSIVVPQVANLLNRELMWQRAPFASEPSATKKAPK